MKPGLHFSQVAAFSVIPAKAGIFFLRLYRGKDKILVFAGMTNIICRGLLLLTSLACSLPAHASNYIDVQEVKAGTVTAWLAEDHSLPVFSVQVAFEAAGSAHDPNGKEGRALLASGLMTEGAGEMDALAFQQALESYAIDMNVDVERDILTANLRSLSEHKAKAFELLGLALTKPRFDIEDFERRRRQLLVKIRQAATNPHYQLLRTVMRESYGNHSYGTPEMGDEASVGAMTVRDIQEYHQRYLSRGNIVISVAGDITPAELAPLLDRAFAVLPAQVTLDSSVSAVQVRGDGRIVAKELNIPQTLVAFVTEGIAREDARFMTAFVFNQLIGGSTMTSRLGKAIREDKGLAYYANSYLTPMRYGNQWGGVFATRGEQVREAYDTLMETVKTIADNGVEASELEDAKRYITGSFVLSLDTNGGLVSFLTTMQRFNLGRDYLERRNALVEAVTKKDIDALARELLNPHRWLTVLVGSFDAISTILPKQSTAP